MFPASIYFIKWTIFFMSNFCGSVIIEGTNTDILAFRSGLAITFQIMFLVKTTVVSVFIFAIAISPDAIFFMCHSFLVSHFVFTIHYVGLLARPLILMS